MPSPRLRILNMRPLDEWKALRDAPRFVQPVRYSTDPCADCEGRCCSADIRITTVEALRISTALSLPVLEMVEVVDAAREPVSRWPAIPVMGGEVRLRLRKDDATAQCIFLHRLGARGRCSIHGVRPGPCRLYPFHVEVGRRRVEVGNPQRCPSSWVKTPALESRAAADLAAWDADMRAERALVRAWSRSAGEDRSVPAYMAFALRRLARRLGVDAEELLRDSRPRALPARRLW